MLGWELPPYNSGGLGVACYQMCRQLALDGIDIDFVLPYRHPPTRERPVDFMRLHAALPISAAQMMNVGGVYDSCCFTCSHDDCDHASIGDLRGQQQRYIAFAESIAAQHNYDAIHAHDWLTFEAGMLAKQASGKPLIAHVHSTEFDRSGNVRGNSLVHDIEYNCLTMADRIVAVSNITKDIIVREYGIPASKVGVVHNGIAREGIAIANPTNSYAYLSEIKQHGYKIVVSLGRLTIQKGLHYMLQAARQVISYNNKVIFLIAGDGEQREELLRLSAELGISQNIIFTGFLRGKPWRDAYTIGDIFVMSSISEPFGLTALEAAGSHNAILLSKQSGVSEVLKSTISFDYWDTEALANGILNIASHSVLQQSLANNAQQEVTMMSWQSAANQLRTLYRHLQQGAAV